MHENVNSLFAPEEEWTCEGALLKKNFFFIYKEIPMGEVAKSYMSKGFLIYEKKRTYLVIYEEALVIYDFATTPF